MRKHIILSCLAIACAMAFGAVAQTEKGYVKSEPGKVAVAKTTQITGSIKSVNKDTREVTVVGPKGKEVTVEAGEEVKNFDQLKAGDAVTIKYVEALALELKKGGGQEVKRTETGGTAKAEPGEKPGAAIGRKVTVVGDVIATDPKTQKITVKGPDSTQEVKVNDPEQFKLIAKGDQIQLTYAEAAAVNIQPAKPKAKSDAGMSKSEADKPKTDGEKK
jgi:hypothetical protein